MIEITDKKIIIEGIMIVTSDNAAIDARKAKKLNVEMTNLDILINTKWVTPNRFQKLLMKFYVIPQSICLLERVK